MSIETDIYLALCAAVNTAVTAVAPSLPVKYPLLTFKPPTNLRYFEIVHIPNDDNTECWGDEKTYRGLLRILIHWKIDEQGIVPPMNIITAIKPYFVKGKILFLNNTSLSITDNPTLLSNIGDEIQSILPLSIQYKNFIAP